MRKPVPAVAVILEHKNEYFVIKRSPKLRAFPGFHAFPGGKIDKEDYQEQSLFKVEIPDFVLNAAIREIEEELSFVITPKKIDEISEICELITPENNPYRYHTYFIKIKVKEREKFTLDNNEIIEGNWTNSEDFLRKYEKDEVLMVPPVLNIFKYLSGTIPKDEIDSYIHCSKISSVNFLKNLKIYFVPSHTLPPANVTNCFLIGSKKKFAVDPAPKNLELCELLCERLGPIEFIVLTHHHQDHIENANVIAKKKKCPIYCSQQTKENIETKNASYFQNIKYKIIGEEIIFNEGFSVKTMFVPGHDNGQIALYESNKKWFIAGDLYQGIGSVVIAEPEGNMSEYFKTLEKVISFNPKVTFPSHGHPCGGVFPIERVYKHRIEREKSIKELFLKGKKEEEILKEIYFDIPKPLIPYALENIKSHIKKIKIEST